MSKKVGYCQVKGCENKAKYFICTHDEDDRDICESCVNKYYKRGVKMEAYSNAQSYSDMDHLANGKGDIPTSVNVFIAIGVLICYTSYIIEFIYGAKNSKKIDKMIGKFFDLVFRDRV